MVTKEMLSSGGVFEAAMKVHTMFALSTKCETTPALVKCRKSSNQRTLATIRLPQDRSSPLTPTFIGLSPPTQPLGEITPEVKVKGIDLAQRPHDPNPNSFLQLDLVHHSYVQDLGARHTINAPAPAFSMAPFCATSS